jgi:Amt family ammonium transporter
LFQLAKVVVVMAYSGVVTYVILKLVGALTPLKASAQEEGLGMDATQHGEGAYSSGEGAILVNSEAAPPAGRKPVAGTD